MFAPFAGLIEQCQFSYYLLVSAVGNLGYKKRLFYEGCCCMPLPHPQVQVTGEAESGPKGENPYIPGVI